MLTPSLPPQKDSPNPTSSNHTHTTLHPWRVGDDPRVNTLHNSRTLSVNSDNVSLIHAQPFSPTTWSNTCISPAPLTHTHTILPPWRVGNDPYVNAPHTSNTPQGAPNTVHLRIQSSSPITRTIDSTCPTIRNPNLASKNLYTDRQVTPSRVFLSGKNSPDTSILPWRPSILDRDPESPIGSPKGCAGESPTICSAVVRTPADVVFLPTGIRPRQQAQQAQSTARSLPRPQPNPRKPTRTLSSILPPEANLRASIPPHQKDSPNLTPAPYIHIQPPSTTAWSTNGISLTSLTPHNHTHTTLPPRRVGNDPRVYTSHVSPALYATRGSTTLTHAQSYSPTTRSNAGTPPTMCSPNARTHTLERTVHNRLILVMLLCSHGMVTPRDNLNASSTRSTTGTPITTGNGTTTTTIHSTAATQLPSSVTRPLAPWQRGIPQGSGVSPAVAIHAHLATMPHSDKLRAHHYHRHRLCATPDSRYQPCAAPDRRHRPCATRHRPCATPDCRHRP